MTILPAHHFVARNLAATTLGCPLDHAFGASLAVRHDAVSSREEQGRLIIYVPPGSDLAKVQDAFNMHGTTLPAWEIREAPAS